MATKKPLGTNKIDPLTTNLIQLKATYEHIIRYQNKISIYKDMIIAEYMSLICNDSVTTTGIKE